MKKTTIILLGIAALIFACFQVSTLDNVEANTYDACSKEIYDLPFFAKGDSLKYGHTIPTHFSLPPAFGYTGFLEPETQVHFDHFGWQSFVAMNWPAGDSFHADTTKSISDTDGDRVWERYYTPAQVFAENSICDTNDSAQNGKKRLTLMAKNTLEGTGELDDFINAGRHPLIDKNNNFVLFEVRMNEVEKTYICGNHLNTTSGQQNFYDKSTATDPDKFINFPTGDKAGNEGATEIKAAWRIISEDEKDRYYHREADIIIPADKTESGTELRVVKTVGLIGLHIARKVVVDGEGKINPWLWSTFEHVDNVPELSLDSLQMNEERPAFSLYNANCTTCPVAKPPSSKDGYKWAAKEPYAANYAKTAQGGGGQSIHQKYGSQIIRPYGLFETAQCLNNKWQAKLDNSVWKNYKLISTQWRITSGEATPGEPPTTIDIPLLNANSSMESFMLNEASCASCHAHASIKVKSKKTGISTKADSVNIGADHSFLLHRAFKN